MLLRLDSCWVLSKLEKSSQASVSTQQIPENYNRINLKFRKFKVANKCPFLSTDKGVEGWSGSSTTPAFPEATPMKMQYSNL